MCKACKNMKRYSYTSSYGTDFPSIAISTWSSYDYFSKTKQILLHSLVRFENWNNLKTSPFSRNHHSNTQNNRCCCQISFHRRRKIFGDVDEPSKKLNNSCSKTVNPEGTYFKFELVQYYSFDRNFQWMKTLWTLQATILSVFKSKSASPKIQVSVIKKIIYVWQKLYLDT